MNSEKCVPNPVRIYIGSYTIQSENLSLTFFPLPDVGGDEGEGGRIPGEISNIFL
jgi:hypothetical protein